MESFWTDERWEIAQQMRIDGKSCSEIQAAIGASSRSAVAGRFYRMGIAPPHRTNQPARSRTRRRNSFSVKRAPTVETPTPINAATISFRPEGPLHFTHPDWHPYGMCRFPLGDLREKDFAYCGAPIREDGVSYCYHHCHVAFQPPR